MKLPESIKSLLALVGFGALVIVALNILGAGIVAGILLLNFCDHQEYYRYTNPDGSKDAVIFERSCGMRSAFRVAVVPVGKKKLRLGRSVPMANFRDFNPMVSTVRWRDPKSLAVCVGPGKPQIIAAKIDGVSVFPDCDRG